MVLVLETIGSVENFLNVTRNIDGLEWLGETEIDEIEPEFGFENDKNAEKTLTGRLFLVMSDDRALREIVNLHSRWQADATIKFPLRLAPLKKAFQFLRAIRPWAASDRLRETGVTEDWAARASAGQDVVPFEAELWFRESAATRARTLESLRELVAELDGEIVEHCTIPEIGYHAILGRIPVEHAMRFAEHEEIALLQCDQVMCFRPVGQCAVPGPTPEPTGENGAVVPEIGAGQPGGSPVVALLDGLPLGRHESLDGRLLIDDPDGFEEGYMAASRSHGTAMASLICHGDLTGAEVPMAFPLYVRPIMKARQLFDGRWEESIPEEVLTIDLIHRAVRRLFEQDGDELPVAPEVRIINLSIGDRCRPFDRAMSAWARLLDWLSDRYGVLFIVSAGNHVAPLELDVPRGELGGLSQEDLEAAVIRALAVDSRHRRILSPAESVNALTVGASHDDLAGDPPPAQLDPYISRELPATYTAHGLGYRRTVKPDIFLPGGRMIFQESRIMGHPKVLLDGHDFRGEPGQRVASPGGAGELGATRFCCGTSNAAALATRAGARLFEMIEAMRSEGAELPPDHDAVLIKALLVHGAAWGSSFRRLRELLRDGTNSKTFKSYVSRFLGYGATDVSRVLACAAQRVTVLGVGTLEAERADEFSFPLPACLSASTDKRRITITMAYLTPVSPNRQPYRRAHLWFDPRNDLTPTRQEAEHRMVQRGTVQHEIVEGEKALDFQEGGSVAIKVNCREDAGHFIEPIRYALAVTLEVAPELGLPIYEEVRTRLAVPIVSQP